MYQPNVLIDNNGIIIAFRHIEAIGQDRSEEDLIIDRLKDDVIFDIFTTSGNKYSISVRLQRDAYKLNGSIDELHSAILDKWANK